MSFADFPKLEDILAVACIESNYKPRARNGISNGIMQVNRGPFDLVLNMQSGVSLLRSYYLLLGSEKAAVIAYNAGPTNYKRGRFKNLYWNKYLEVRDGYTEKAPVSKTVGVATAGLGVGSGVPEPVPHREQSLGHADRVCVQSDGEACGGGDPSGDIQR